MKVSLRLSFFPLLYNPPVSIIKKPPAVQTKKHFDGKYAILQLQNLLILDNGFKFR